MKLHEIKEIPPAPNSNIKYTITKVPGGWIYNLYESEYPIWIWYHGRKCRVLHYDKAKKMYRINILPGWGPHVKSWR